MATRLEELRQAGQSPWIDFIQRELIASGGLKDLIEKGITGVTANPTIFERAISGNTDYDEAVREMVARGASPGEIYEGLIVEDIRTTADVLRPIYDATDGADGYVSIEVSPRLAYDTHATIEEARKFFSTIGRPNVLIKVPATNEGIPAIRQLLSEGINVNITLIFSVDFYEQVMDAYLDALEARASEGKDLSHIASVASFFVSRVDTEVDERLDALIRAERDEARRRELEGLKGKAAIANAKIAYERFQRKFSGERFQRLRAKGARVQRPLWASTSTKNPAYSDVMYVDELIGPDTVNTMPPATIEAFLDHGTVARTVDKDLEGAHATIEKLEALGIGMKDVTDKLQADGVRLFAESFENLENVIREKHDVLLSEVEERQSAQLGDLAAKVGSRLKQFDDESFPRRLWQRDGTLWKKDAATTEKINNRLGWLPVVEEMSREADELERFAAQLKDEGYTDAVLLGMGGSSLAPDVLEHTFGPRSGYPRLFVLDTTDTDSILAVQNQVDLARTVFIVSSKSGTTLETLSLYHYFWERLEEVKGQRAGENFVAITDPGTPLASDDRKRGFRRVFENREDIGGRYSALSYFGLVPGAIIGADIEKLLGTAREMAEACGPETLAEDDPGLWLGAVMGEAARAGRDKLTLVTSPGIATFGYWVEQLIAESTGKEGVGILPVEGEALGPPSVYGADRLFVHLDMGAPEDRAAREKLGALARAGHPVVTLRVPGPLGLGGEFLRWEIATAAAGAVLGINPFDEPNVQESKDNTSRLLEEYEQKGRLPEGTPDSSTGEVAVFGLAGRSAADALGRFFSEVRPGDYVAIMAYVQRTDTTEHALDEIRLTARDALKVATTVGFGPRFLH